ncbi:MAG: hydrolase [Campylobacterota bacterium]|nr:hydrolase [Campylobacterota bacterium]
MITSDYKPFEPAIGLRNRHFQTLFPPLFRRQKRPEVEIERFELEDGDFVECFWHNRPNKGDNRPIATLFHGLEGSFDSPYIQGMMHALKRDGFSSVIMHFRGCSGIKNRLFRSYHSGKTDDAKAWFTHLHQHYPQNPLFAVGYSLGGNMLLKLLGEQQNSSLLRAAVSISAPMQLDISADRVNRGFSKLYQYHLMRQLKHSLLQKYQDHDMQSIIGIEPKAVKKLKNFWEFDAVYTGPVNGFSSATDYYQKSSSKQFLKMIKRPTLIIQALDDPFMTPQMLPKEDEISSKVQIELYPHGGHVGFVSGSFLKPRYWLEDRIIKYFKTFTGDSSC